MTSSFNNSRGRRRNKRVTGRGAPDCSPEMSSARTEVRACSASMAWFSDSSALAAAPESTFPLAPRNLCSTCREAIHLSRQATISSCPTQANTLPGPEQADADRRPYARISCCGPQDPFATIQKAGCALVSHQKQSRHLLQGHARPLATYPQHWTET